MLYISCYHINTQNSEYKNNKAYRIRNTFRHMGKKQLFKHDVQTEILGNPAKLDVDSLVPRPAYVSIYSANVKLVWGPDDWHSAVRLLNASHLVPRLT